MFSVSHSTEALYSNLPGVDGALRSRKGESWQELYPRELVVSEIRAALAEARRLISAGEWDSQAPAQFVEETVDAALERLAKPSLREVINATGVILHTNLGRAPLSESAIEAIGRTARGYSNLEFDLESGSRGKRDVHTGELLERLLGAPAIVVNNNAAAIYLALNELAADGETLVSRGELIEIGDGFRIPDIMERSGTRLREVGTTNRTRVEDYRAAAGEQTRALLRVHPSNFKIVGFTARPELTDLAALASELGVPLIEDLGSGCLFDLAQEPPVRQSLEAGVDIVTFSGDKLLGGPQAGIIAGRADLVARVRRNPMFRALRADKLIYAALEATLREYVFERHERIPTLRMIGLSSDELKQRSERFVQGLDVPAEVRPGESVLGGGSTPAESIPSWVISLAPPPGLSAAALAARLRKGDPAVVARIEDDNLVLDLRTVFSAQEEALARVLSSVEA